MSLQFFVADNGSDGQELWVTDGTSDGTFELKDINPGAGNGNIGNLVQSNGIMYFTAYDGTSTHLWRSDGTQAGTYALTSSTNGDNTGNLFNVNGRLFFTGSDSVHGSGLFVTDGTTGGTQFVGAINSPSGFIAVGNALFFQSYDPTSGYELWKSDGTAAGTGLVKDIFPGGNGSSLGNFTALDGKLYFTANDGTHGNEVWVSDGTAGGTFQLKDINLGASDSSAGNFFAAAGHMFFTANDGAHGTQFWVTDGTTSGTHVLSSPNPFSGTQTIFNHVFYYVASDPSGGSAIYTSEGTSITKLSHLSSFSGHFFNLGSSLMFYGDDGVHGGGLYTFDGTSLAFISSVSGGFDQPVASGGKLYFVSYDPTHGHELWVSDGTAAGTHITADVNPGSYDASIGNISAVGGGVVFTAFRPDVGTELFFSDGTQAGTGLLSNVNPTGNHSPSLSFSPPVQAGSLGFFAADDGVHGNELWVTDGTIGGSHMVSDLVFGGSGASPQNFYAANGTIFFTADDGVSGRQLYTSDGTTMTRLTSGNLDQPYNSSAYFFTYGSHFYYFGYDTSANGGYALFTSDGTVAGTTRVQHMADFNSSPLLVGGDLLFRGNDGVHGYGLYSFNGSAISFIAAVGDFQDVVASGNKLFWHSNDGGNGAELWVSDGTAGGTHVVADVNPGPYDSNPYNITSLGNGSVVFTAYNPSTGNELYVSDGTQAGTHLLQDVNATGNHGQSLNFNTGPVTAGNLTFFAADDGIHGNELWVSDGTAGGSHMVTDLIVGGNSSNPGNFYAVGNMIFFMDDDGVNGRQLYTSDGNTVTRLTSGDRDQPYNDAGRFFTLNGHFYYMGYEANANGGGYSIFTSDGTVAGTHSVYHFAGGNSFSSPLHVGNTIVFYGNDGTHGNGLYAFDGAGVSFVANVSDYEYATVSAGNLFWRSNDGGNGSELWVTDGTAAGTHLTKDINPGSYDSNAWNITSLGNGSVVFTAFNPDTGNEIYVSDGTSAGTKLLRDLNTTGNHGQSLNFNSGEVTAGSLTFFAADDGMHGNELWVTDGTTGGSHMVSDLLVGGSSSNPQNLYSAGGKIFFLADDGVHGRQLYTSNGTTVTQLTGGGLDQPYNDGGRFFTLNNKFYYLGYDSDANGGGYALFTSDGTVAGTHSVFHFANGNSYNYPIHLGSNVVFYANDGTNGTGLYAFNGTTVSFVAGVNDYEDAVVSGGNLFWRSSDGGNGYELWVSNGTSGGTHLVQDINPGGNWSYPDQITSLGNGSVVFTADDGTHGREIWVSDGTSAGTFMLGDLFPDAQGSNPGSLIQVGSQVFFTANYFSNSDGAHGTELFVTDGTSAGTHMVRDINPGSASTSFGSFYAFGGKLYFSAYDPANGGWHLYQTDGTDAGTHFVTPGDGSTPGGAGNFIKADATHFFFTGDSGLFYSDGTSAGTVNVGSSSGFDINTTTYANGHLLYRAYDGSNGYELWTSDGTVAGTHRVTDTLIPNSSNATSFTFSGGKIYFYADDGVHGANELFVTDGTTAGTILLNDFNGAGGTSYGANFAFGGKFYFTAYDGNNGGWHLYQTDGTVAGTHAIMPVDGSFPGAAGNFIKADATHFFFTGDSGMFYSDGTNAGTVNLGGVSGFDANYATYVGGHLLYRAADGPNGYELWTSDGTVAGTHRVTDTLIPNSSNATSFTFSGGKIYFYADDGVHGGNELFVTDGTTAGTILLNDFNGASGTSYGANFAFGSKFYFTAYDGNNGGWHLYQTDGTIAGTRAITPVDGSFPGAAGNFIQADATHFFFTGDSGLFYSDGTNAGTVRISDTSGFSDFSVVGGDLYFHHYDNTNGYELWKSDGTAAGTVRLTDTQIPNSSNPGGFTAVDNSPPTVKNAGTAAITDQQTAQVFHNVVIGDTDSPAQTLTVTITPDDAAKGHFTTASLSASGFVAGGVNGAYTFTGTAAQATAAIDALVYQPIANRLVVGDSEAMTFTISVNDGAGGSVLNAQTIVTQTSANDAPVGVSNSAAINEDATASATTRATGVIGNDSDADVNETGTLKVVGAHSGSTADTSVAASGNTVIHGTFGDLTIAADGTYSYTPNTAAAEALPQGQVANEVFTYTLADVHGVTSTATLTFNITGEEDGPVAAADAKAVNEDATSSATTRTGGLLANDTDVDTGEAATLKITGAHFGAVADTSVAASGTTTVHGTYGDLILAADGTYSYTPNTPAAERLTQGQAKSDVFSYTITDAQGQTSTATVTFNVTGQNDAPVAVNNIASINEDATASATTRATGVLGNDSDIDTGEAATLKVTGAHFATAADTVVAATGTTIIHGTYGDLILAADGTYTYTANAAAAEALPQGQLANEVFTYTIADIHGATSTAKLTFTITGQEDVSTAVADSASVSEGATTSASSRPTGLLGNDSDIDTGETATLRVTGAHFGTAPDSAVAASGGTLIHGTYGDLTIAADGTYSYAANSAAAVALPQGQSASDVFAYTETDAQGQTATSTLTMTVTGQNQGPSGVNDAVAVNEDATAAATTRAAGVLGNDTDPDTGEAGTLKVTGAHFGTAADTAVAASGATTIHGTYGDLKIAADGTYSYTASSGAAEALGQGQAASDVFSYSLADVHGATSTATLAFNVIGQNDAPTAVANTASVDEDATVTATTRAAGLLGNDSDVDTGDTAGLMVVGAHFGSAADTSVAASGTTVIHGIYGDLILAADGTYSFTPNSAAAERLTEQGTRVAEKFTYTVADAHGGTSTSTLTFFIAGTNDAPVVTAQTAAVNEDATVFATTRSAGVLGRATDADSGETATLSVTGAHAGSGANTAVSASGTTVIHGTYGDLVIAADGTYSYAANSNAAEALGQGQHATDAFSVTVADIHGATGIGSLSFDVTGQNDAPTTSVASGLTTGKHATLDLKGKIGLADVDAGSSTMTATLGVTTGTLHLAPGSSGVTISGNDSASVTVTGTLAQLQALLSNNATSIVQYLTDTDTPPASTTLSVMLHDAGSPSLAGSSSATIAINASNNPAIAVDDANTVKANGVIAGASVFGNDSDPYGPPLSISAVNGSSSLVGHPITLASGALLTVHANGTYNYNPNHAFDYLTAITGAANSSAVDSFTYTLADGQATATVSITVQGRATNVAAQGTAGDDTMTGTTVNDTFLLNDGGHDHASGLGGNDTFYFGGALDASDVVDGGIGIGDRVVLQGDYSAGFTFGIGNLTGVEQLVLLSGHDTSFGGVGTSLDSYDLTTVKGNIAAGTTFVVQGSGLLAGENLTFNGSTQLSSKFIMYGGMGDDHFTGGARQDVFVFTPGHFNVGDTIDGQAGVDQLVFQGDFTGANALTIGAQLTNVETITLLSGSDTTYGTNGGTDSYQITVTDGTLAAGKAMTVDASSLHAGETLTFDGSAETNGHYTVTGGAGNDWITGGAAADRLNGGAGNDHIVGGKGADTLSGGGGNDMFVFTALADSKSGSRDTILDFSHGDTIDVQGVGLSNFIGSAAFDHHAGEIRATYQGGIWHIDGDVDGNGLADFQLLVAGSSSFVWSASDFALAGQMAAMSAMQPMSLHSDTMARMPVASLHGGSDSGSGGDAAPSAPQTSILDSGFSPVHPGFDMPVQHIHEPQMMHITGDYAL